MIPDKYVFSEHLAFINEGISVHVWGPATDDEVVEHVRTLHHKLGTRVYSPPVIFPYVAYCTVCQTAVTRVVDDMYIGSMMETTCRGYQS